MRMRDAAQGFGLVSIVLHWLVAGFVVFMFVSGKVMEALDKAPMAREVRAVHISIGVIAACFIVARLIWRIAQGSPEKIGGDTPLNKLAAVVQWALLALMIGSVITGLFAPWSNGRPVQVFGLPLLPSPMAKNESLHHLFEEVHEVLAHGILALVVLHVAGAIKHAVIDRDGLLARMVRPASEA